LSLLYHTAISLSDNKKKSQSLDLTLNIASQLCNPRLTFTVLGMGKPSIYAFCLMFTFTELPHPSRLSLSAQPMMVMVPRVCLYSLWWLWFFMKPVCVKAC